MSERVLTPRCYRCLVQRASPLVPGACPTPRSPRQKIGRAYHPVFDATRTNDATLACMQESVTRELVRLGSRWRVRELDASAVPGARGSRCLIFESEAVVRRFWSYPRDWANLSDDRLWQIVEPPTEQAASTYAGVPSHAVAERARTLLEDLRSRRERCYSAGDSGWSLLEGCGDTRHEMEHAVRAYADRLRRDGVPPERALVLLKQAVRDGIRGTRAEEAITEAVIGSGVEWCISAYYGDEPRYPRARSSPRASPNQAE